MRSRKKIDINPDSYRSHKKGTLYMSNISATIVLCTKHSGKDASDFSGIVVDNRGSGPALYEYSTIWQKENFDVYLGTLTLRFSQH